MRQFNHRDANKYKNYSETKNDSNNSSDADTDDQNSLNCILSHAEIIETRSASTSTISNSSSTSTESIFEPRSFEEMTPSDPCDRSASPPPKIICFLSQKPEFMAQQITLLMHDIYVNIPFDDYANNYYTNQYIQMFNQMVVWTQYSILSALDCKQRAKMIKKWIKCMNYLLKFGNFHGLIAINCALMSNVVYEGKLNKAWSILKKKHKAKLRKINVFVGYDHNYRLLREEMMKSKGPILPYFGLFKRDCLFIKEYKHGKDGIYDDLRRQYEGYKEGKYQKFEHNQSVQTWIHHQLQETLVLTQDDIRRMSDNVRDLDESK